MSTSPTDTAPSTVTLSGSATSPTAPDLEGFSCETLEEVRVRFGDPGYIRGNEVAVYAGFLGAPPGDKFLRIYWDHANKPAEFQIVDTEAGEVRRDNDELFDIEEIVEHTYEDLSGPTERTVRVELIHEDGNTRLWLATETSLYGPLLLPWPPSMNSVVYRTEELIVAATVQRTPRSSRTPIVESAVSRVPRASWNKRVAVSGPAYSSIRIRPRACPRVAPM